MLYCDGLSAPEGPVALHDGNWLVVEMGAERGCITHLTQAGQDKRIVAKTGRPNGLAVDHNQVLWCAESLGRSVLRVTLEGQVEEFLTCCGDEPFLFPNDLAFGPDGKLYLTDSGIRFEDFAPGGIIRPDYNEADIDGRVYRIDVQTREIEKIDSGIRFTNGITFDAQGNLYANETITGEIFRYEYDQGKFGPRQSFGNVLSAEPAEGLKGPDGMKFGQDGRLYVTVFNQREVTVLNADGSLFRRMKTRGKDPTNLAFGLPGDPRIYVTEVEHGTLEILEVECEGLPLYDGSQASDLA